MQQVMPVVPVILCGGHGTRLWPLSTPEKPKQYLNLTGKRSSFQETVLRFSKPNFSAPLIVANRQHLPIIEQQLAEISVTEFELILEPCPKNTAAAVLAATLHVETKYGPSLVLVSPADHRVTTVDELNRVVLGAVSAASQGAIVTVGIKPTRAETGYGYLHAEPGSSGVVALRQFVEKPDFKRATTMIESGNWFWNAGLFLFSTTTMRLAFSQHTQSLEEAMNSAFSSSILVGHVRAFPEREWALLPSMSIDVVIMEKASNMYAVIYDGHWSDLGSWLSIWNESAKDHNGNVIKGETQHVSCSNSLLHCNTDAMQVVAVGLDHIAVVVSGKSILVTDLRAGAAFKGARSS